MQKEDIELLAQKVERKTLTKEDGARMIMEFVFRHPSLFGLKMLDEDQLIDFLIYQFPKFIKIFSIYNKSYGTFTSFLQGSVRGTYITWRKRCVRNSVLSSSLTAADELQYEENMLRYKLPEEELIEKEDALSVASCSDNEPALCFPLFHRFDGTPSIRYKDPLLEKNRVANMRRIIILVLTLKSIFYVDDALLHKVSVATGYSMTTLLKMKNTINETLTNKIERRDACLRCRDNAYFFHRKYLAESTKLNKQTTWAKLILEKYKKQTETWIDKNNRLSLKGYAISASNRAVGQILGISPRHVFYVIRQLRDNMDTNTSKEYHT